MLHVYHVRPAHVNRAFSLGVPTAVPHAPMNIRNALIARSMEGSDEVVAESGHGSLLLVSVLIAAASRATVRRSAGARSVLADLA